MTPPLARSLWECNGVERDAFRQHRGTFVVPATGWWTSCSKAQRWTACSRAASACGLQSSPGGDVGASRASSARSLLRMQIMVQRRQRHLNILLLCSSGPARAASARHGSHMRTRATTACRRPEERASSFYVRLEISATTSATTTRVRDAILPAQEEG